MAHDLRDYVFLEEINGLFDSLFLFLLPNKIHVHVLGNELPAGLCLTPKSLL